MIQPACMAICYFSKFAIIKGTDSLNIRICSHLLACVPVLQFSSENFFMPTVLIDWAVCFSFENNHTKENISHLIYSLPVVNITIMAESANRQHSEDIRINHSTFKLLIPII